MVGGDAIVTLESLSVAEQVSLMVGAKAVVAAHGAGLTNLVFCQPHTKVIEIFSPQYVPSCYWSLSDRLDLNYYYLEGEPIENFYSLHPNTSDRHRDCFAWHQDILVNLDRLLETIQYASL